MCKRCHDGDPQGPMPTRKEWMDHISIVLAKQALEKGVVCEHSIDHNSRFRREHYADFYKHLPTLWTRMDKIKSNKCVYLTWEEKADDDTKWVLTLREDGTTAKASDLWNFVPWSEDCTVKLGTRTNGISLLNFRTFEREIQQATRSLIEIDENFSIISTKPAEKGTKRKAKGEQKTTTT